MPVPVMRDEFVRAETAHDPADPLKAVPVGECSDVPMLARSIRRADRSRAAGVPGT